MNDVMELIDTYILPHWPFFSWLLTAMLIGQVTKKTLWTKKNASKYADRTKHRTLKQKMHHAFFWWMRKTMVLHPVIAGAIIGLIWKNPESADPPWSTPTSVGYFAMAGALSTWAYELIRGLAKKRGVDLPLPGLSEPPSKPADDAGHDTNE